MTKRYYIRFLIRDQADDLIFEARKQDWDRLETAIQNAYSNDRMDGFFWFDAIDGRSIVINLQRIQATRFLWDRTDLPPDINCYDGPTKIYLARRAEPIEDCTECLEELFDFFTNLQHGPSTVPYPSFIDEDGELIYFDAREIVWVSAPAHRLQDGARLIAGGEKNDSNDEAV